MALSKEQIEQLLKDSIKVDDEALKTELVRVALSGYMDEEDLSDWEQLRYVKSKVDSLWQALKKCSEQSLVKVKVRQMLAALPQPRKRVPGK